MFRKNLRHLLISAAVAIAGSGLPARAQTIVPPPMPADIQVPAGNIAFLQASAEGTQNYVCLPSGAGLAWIFQAPQATLFLTLHWPTGDVVQQIATHFLSPNPAESAMPARATWQSSLDTSAVWAKKIKESSDPAFVAPGAIPWLLLQTAGTRRGPGGGAMLAQTSYIQRVNTTGGMAAGPCSGAGALQFVPYTATYIFYRAAGSN
jgi:Protein of unknown function (DUF3455)